MAERSFCSSPSLNATDSVARCGNVASWNLNASISSHCFGWCITQTDQTDWLSRNLNTWWHRRPGEFVCNKFKSANMLAITCYILLLNNHMKLGESDNWQLRSKIHFRPDGNPRSDSRWLESAIRIWASRFSVVDCFSLKHILKQVTGSSCHLVDFPNMYST